MSLKEKPTAFKENLVKITEKCLEYNINSKVVTLVYFGLLYSN